MTVPSVGSADRVIDSRVVPLGGVRGLSVHRTLPQRGLPTVGPWCFVDLFGPTFERMNVLPHPHTGLQTVTWPIAGEIRHRDSRGSDVLLRPGELNLMTAGDGVSHSEVTVARGPTLMHGIQLWVALPDSRRNGPSNFEHHAELPHVTRDGWSATVMMGTFDGVSSPATTYSPMVGVELKVRAGRLTVPLDPEFEHAVLAIDGHVVVDDFDVAHRQMYYLAPGRDQATVDVRIDTTLLLIGGAPFEEDLVMWWNFIGRTHDEIADARADWEAESERFGFVDGHHGEVIPAPPLPNVRLKPRRRTL
ncbi:MAG: quercetin 2,3-dioxygenase [Nocardioidaceae bacterium]|nr:quercetin 2,3-dioxygenase [Nocardioidaceae bacterium]